MLEQGLVKRHFLGRDGFIWWIGQVVDQTQWAGNFPEAPTRTTDDHKGFDFRYKVRIMGYHTACPTCLLYTSPSPRDPKTSRMPSSA